MKQQAHKSKRFIPVTPGGSFVDTCEAPTKDEAIKKLMKAAAHMPYKTWADFKKRGYEIAEVKK